MVVLLPILTQPQKVRSAEVLSLGFAIFRISGKLLLDNSLSRDARMVAAGNVDSRELSHTMPSYKGVLKRECESMPDVQLAGHL